MSKASLMGKSVFNKRTGLMGTVVGEDGLTLMIDTQGTVKTVTRSTFTRWFKVVEDDVPEVEEKKEEEQVVSTPETSETEESSTETKEEEEKEKGTRFNPSGDKGIGQQLADKFLYLVKDMANQDLDITSDESGNKLVIKYNGKNIFECTTAKRRFSVLCHPDSLTAQNVKNAFKVFPKEWGWALRAKFVFTSIDEVPLMKSIITDGMFYRQIKEGE